MTGSTRLPRATPDAAGISPDCIVDFLERVQKEVNSLHSFMLLKGGAVIAEGWWQPYRPDSPHMLFSLSKSFTSTAVGLAVAEGRLTVDDPVVDIFAGEAPDEINPRLAAMKVSHLLSMTSGHDQDTTERIMWNWDPVRAFLGLEVEHEPGTHFVYNTGATYVLSGMIQKLTGQTVCEYLTHRLFQPLGIGNPTWESHPNGTNFGGWGLNITTEDIACFGQLYLQNGEWQGRQLIPAAWVKAATSKQVDNGSDPDSDWMQGYGYQFWRCRHNMYRGDGAFGQYVVVMPELEAVLAMTGGLQDMQVPLNIVWETLLPGLQGKSRSKRTGDSLRESLTGLELSKPQGAGNSAITALVSGKTFSLEPNAVGLCSVSFDFAARKMFYQSTTAGNPDNIHELNFGIDRWMDGEAYLLPPNPALPSQLFKVAASGAWTAGDTFSLAVCQYETPFVAYMDFRFEDNLVTCTYRLNASFGPTEFKAIIGKTS